MKIKNNLIKLLVCSSFFLLLCIGGFNLTNLVSANTTDIPPSRNDHAMVYDSQNNQIILFGGINEDDNSVDLETTWIFSSQNQTWTELSGITSPGGRFAHRMVYNSITGKIILFGGISTSTYDRVNDTWEFDPITYEWTKLYPTTSPSARSAHAMYFDPVYNEIILFGGGISTMVLDDTWIYNCTANNWHQIYPPYHPMMRYGHSFVYDEEKQVGVFFGGRLGNSAQQDDTWYFYRSSSSWAMKYPAVKPSKRYFTSMVYNPNDETIIMFGGDNEDSPIRATDDTWIFDSLTGDWMEIATSDSPPPRTHHAMVFDQFLNKAILFGGAGQGYSIVYGDLWVYDPVSASWSQEFTSAVPIPIWFVLLSFVSVFAVTRLLKSKYLS